MSLMDFNDAEPQRETGGIIPEGTIALAVMAIRPGGGGPGGWLKRSKAGDKEMLDCEFTISSGKFERRKVWSNMVVSPADSEAARITRSQLRGALESARCINAGDDSPEAMAKRQVDGWGAFDALTVCVKVGIKKEAGYEDKNMIRAFVGPDDAGYINPGPQGQHGGFVSAGAAVKSAATRAGGATAAAAGVGMPAWAK